MKTNVKQIILNALEQHKGDDLQRAEFAFKHLSTHELDQEYGQSGQTHRQILDDYRKHQDAVDDAIRWINSL